jgi:hypothetical protein
MSYSLKTGKTQTLEWFQQNQESIKTIVDIGAGSGTYINLIKEENNCCAHANWIGVEVWEPYIKQFELESRYNRIINQDVREINWGSLGKIDAVIAGDVLEHMTKEQAEELVKKILSVADNMIISIPIVHMPQDEHSYENPYEAHIKDNWTHSEVMTTWKSRIYKHYRKSDKSKLGVYWLKGDATILPMKQLHENYIQRKIKPIDWLGDSPTRFDTYKNYARVVDSIAEFGVYTGLSTAAWLSGNPKRLRSYDITDENLTMLPDLYQYASQHSIDFEFNIGNSLEIDIDPVDLLFIDTVHKKKHTNAELYRHHEKVKRYIVLHDTTAFPGVFEAVSEFIQQNTQWKIVKRCEIESGLTVLEKIYD